MLLFLGLLENQGLCFHGKRAFRVLGFWSVLGFRVIILSIGCASFVHVGLQRCRRSVKGFDAVYNYTATMMSRNPEP